MAEVIGVTLAVLALVEPAVKSAVEAYGTYRLTEAFGVDFGEYSRKLEGQRARLQEWSQWPIGFVPNPENSSVSVMLEELAAMRIEFDSCAALRAKYQSDQKLVNRQRIDAESLENSVTFRQKTTWIIKDREQYKESVEKIIESNDLIESIVRAWTLKTVKIKEEEAYNPLPRENSNTIYSLLRLHTALRQSNFQLNEHQTTIGVKLVLDHTSTKENLTMRFGDITLRDDSCIFMVQSLNQHNQSQLLLAETLMYPHGSLSESISSAANQQMNLKSEAFTLTGEISTKDDPKDIHRLFTDTSSSWAPAKSLADLLLCTKLAPSQATRYRLAALVTTNHLRFANIIHPSGKSDPGNFRYFDWEEVEHLDEAAIIEDEDRLLNLCHFAGFGSPPPKQSTRHLGAASGTAPVYNPQIVELGLLLYQIGCWQNLDYSNLTSNSAREKLRDSVSDRLFELHRKTGLRYAETVQKCLDWKVKPVRERANDQPQFYEEVVESLVGLDEAIRARSSAIL